MYFDFDEYKKILIIDRLGSPKLIATVGNQP